MSRFTLRRLFPRVLSAPLWGDRQRWGLTINENDSCWQKWLKTYSDFYNINQREGIGTRVNDAGYRIMRRIDLTGKKVLEIGAGDIRHSQFWRGCPAEYILADVHPDMMQKAKESLSDKGIACRSILLNRKQSLPIEDNSVDVVISFYSLEHLYPLMPYLQDMSRVLRPGGILIGAIPAEGGLAWGLGRLFTSRRWFKKNTSIDPDKIICWEHPNFVDDIISDLDAQFKRQRLTWWPLFVPVMDINLIVQFKYIKD